MPDTSIWRPRLPDIYWRRRRVPLSAPGGAPVTVDSPPGPIVPPSTTPIVPVVTPARQQFRFLAEDIVTGHIKTQDLPLESWSYDETLNRPGALPASLPLTSPFATEELLDPWRTAIYAERDGKIEWGGILTPPQLSLNATALSISCFGWLGYWDHRAIRKDYTPAQVDQFEIFARLVADAQDVVTFGAGYALGITVTWEALSGVLRDRSDDYRPWKAKNLGEALRQLGGLIGGFDFSMQYQLNVATNRIDKAIRLRYPRRGRTTNFVFEYRRGERTNVLQRGFADPVGFAWAGDGWGSGNDDTRLRSSYVDAALRGIYPPYDAAPSWDVSVQATLDEHTVAAFDRSRRPRRVPVVNVDPDSYPKWGDYELGDVVGLRIDDGYGSTDPVTPEPHRITSTRVASDGTYQLVLDEETTSG